MHPAHQTPLSLRIQGLHVTLAGRTVLHDLSLTFARGQITALCGPNGSGKSTVLKSLAGLLPATRGAVWLGDQVLSSWSVQQRARELAILAQSALTPAGMSVRELVTCGRFPQTGLRANLSAQDHGWVSWAIQATGLQDLSERELAALSGGERQRAWIAMALAQGGRILLLDEPTTFLDMRHQVEILRLLRQLVQAHQLTVVCVLHDLNHALAFSDQLVLLREGRVVAAGATRTVASAANLEAVFGVPMLCAELQGQALCLPRMQVHTERGTACA